MATAMRYLHDEASAKDVLQETWIKVFNNINKYRDEGKLLAWLKRILINTTLGSMRKTVSIVELNGAAVDHTMVTTNIENELNLADMMKKVQSTPSPAREVFLMYVIDGLSHKEIAIIMKIKESTSRVHLTNARKYLRRIFTNSQEMSI